jgi:hypothetical protein
MASAAVHAIQGQEGNYTCHSKIDNVHIYSPRCSPAPCVHLIEKESSKHSAAAKLQTAYTPSKHTWAAVRNTTVRRGHEPSTSATCSNNKPASKPIALIGGDESHTSQHPR